MLWSCNAPTTQILVVIDSDLPGAPAFRVWVEDEADAETIAVRTFRVREDDGPVDAGEALTPGTLRLPFSFGVVPPGEDASRSVRITAWALTDDQGDPLQPPRTEFVRGQRIARVNFVKGRTLVLRLPFSSLCLEEGSPRACPREPEEQTCVLGRCVDVATDRLPEVTPGEELEDAGPSDAGPVERTDAAGADAGVLPPMSCAPPGDETIALYPFDGTLASVGGGPEGVFEPDPVAFVSGQATCGQAARFDGTSHIEIPDDDAWDLERGAIDFWFRYDPEATGPQALVSRDAPDSVPGHLSIIVATERRVHARFQNGARDGGSRDEATACSDVLDAGWHHVGLNFDATGITLFVDGIQARPSADHVQADVEFLTPCDKGLDAPAAGLGTLDLPWDVGATRRSGGIDRRLHGEIDHLRIHAAPQRYLPPLDPP